MNKEEAIKAIPDQQLSSTTIINGYEIYEILGKGSFGQVFKAKKDGSISALKLLDLNMIRQRKIEKFVSNEINLMRKMNHKNVVKIYDTFQTTSVIFLVLEYCNQGTLLTHVSKKKPNVEQCVDLFIQILAGVKHIHQKGVLHRDLKPENIFLHDGVLKIADFGLAQFEQDDFVYCGTSFYMAPEVLERKQVSYQSDLWSLGIVLFYMIFRRLPFYSKTNLFRIIKQWTDPNFNILKYFKGQSAFQEMIEMDLADFFKKVLVFDINKRIQFKELFNLVLIEKQMKEEDQKLSFVFYSNLDNCYERAISPIISIIENQLENYQFDQKKQQEQSNIVSNKILESTKFPTDSVANVSRNSIQQTNFQIQVSSTFMDEVPEDDSPNIQSIYPTNNYTQFDKRRQSQGHPLQVVTLDPTKIYIQPTHFSQQRQSVSFLEQLNPKRFSYEDVLSPHIFSDFEVIQPVVNITKADLYPSNQDIFQICSQIKSSIQSFFQEDSQVKHYSFIFQSQQIHQLQTFQLITLQSTIIFPSLLKNKQYETTIFQKNDLLYDFEGNEIVQYKIIQYKKQQDYKNEISSIKQIVYKYQLLDDIVNNLLEFRLGYSTQCLMNFIISKIIIYIIHSAKSYINRSSFVFQKLDVCKKIQVMLSNDLKTWENKMLVYRNGIDLENDIKQQNLKDIINDDTTEVSFFKEIIQPFCIIIELLFSISFQLSESNTGNEKLRFKKYCFYLLLVLNIQYLFNNTKDETKLFEDCFNFEKELTPKIIIDYAQSSQNYTIFDTLLVRFVNFCPLSIPNIKMIEPFSNRKYF